MADRLQIMLELERRGALPPNKAAILQELRRRGAIPGGETSGGGREVQPREPFDPEGSGRVLGAPTPTRMIEDERELEGTGLPPGTEIADVGRQSPQFQDVIKRSGATGKRIVDQGGRYYLTPDRPRTTIELPPDPNVGGTSGGTVETLDPGREIADQRRFEGLTTGSAPAKAREDAGYALDEEQGYRRALGPDAEVRRIESAGPLKGELAFRMGPRPGEDPPAWRTVRGAGEGVSMADVESLKAEVLPTLGGMLGGTVGAAGTPGLAALGAGVGAYLGEIQRLNEGKRRGVIPPETSDMEIILAAMKRAGWEGLGSLGGALAYRLWKAFRRRGIPDIGMSEEAFLKQLGQAEAGLDDEGRRLLTTGDVVGGSPSGARIAAMEEKLRTGTEPAADILRERAQAKEIYGRQRLRAEVPETPVPPESQLGESVSRAAPNAERAMTSTGLGGGRTIHPDVPETGAATRAMVEAGKKAEQAPVSARIEGVAQKMRGRSIEPTNTHDAVMSLESEHFDSVFRKLDEADASLLKDWFKEVEVDLGDGNKIVRPLTYDQIAEGLSRIRRAKRNAFRGTWDGNLETLDQIENSLLADRAKLFDSVPGGAAQRRIQEMAERQWREINDTYQRTAIGDFLKHKAGGAEAVSSERITARLFRDPETARLVGKLAARPGFEAEREAIRATLRWEAFAAAKAEGGDVSEASIKNFVQQNQEILGNFFSPSEIARYYNLGAMMRTRRAMGISKDADPSKWFDKFWKESNPKNAQTTMDRLQQLDPQTAEAVRGMARQRIYDMMTVPGKEATGKAVDPAKFESLMADPGRAEWLARVLDPGFATRLRSVAEAVQKLSPASQKVNLGTSNLSDDPHWRVAQRAGRLFLGVLSREARVYNNAVQMLHEKVRARAAEAIINPRRYAELLRQGKESAAGRSSSAALGWALMGDNPVSEEIRR